jgi:hypothetical protein
LQHNVYGKVKNKNDKKENSSLGFGNVKDCRLGKYTARERTKNVLCLEASTRFVIILRREFRENSPNNQTFSNAIEEGAFIVLDFSPKFLYILRNTFSHFPKALRTTEFSRTFVAKNLECNIAPCLQGFDV